MEIKDETALQFAGDIFEALRAVARPDQAPPMKRYMKGKFEFLGVKSPERRGVLRSFRRFPEGVDPEAVLTALWAYPYREAQYAAVDLAERYVKQGDATRIELYRHFVTDKSWWDTVDAVAAKLIGGHFRRFSHLIIPCTAAWMQSDSLWLRRTCLLFQLTYKGETDAALLFDFIRRLSGSEEFFIRKAVGWSLRQYARTEPEAVRRFVAETALSPLSRREALKHLGEK